MRFLSSLIPVYSVLFQKMLKVLRCFCKRIASYTKFPEPDTLLCVGRLARVNQVATGDPDATIRMELQAFVPTTREK